MAEISKIEMVLLGLISRQPSYAYEIDQFIKETHMRRWVQIGSSSVYQGLERLAKKGLASPKTEQEGKMPVRRRYCITVKGKKALQEAVKKILSHCEDHYLDLNLAILCSHVIPQGKIALLLDERQEELSEKCREIKSHKNMPHLDKIWQREMIISILYTFCKTELKLLKNISRELGEEQG